jgi:hypothetical protein
MPESRYTKSYIVLPGCRRSRVPDLFSNLRFIFAGKGFRAYYFKFIHEKYIHKVTVV